MLVPETFFAKRTSLLKASEIRQLLKWVAEGGIISFGGGMPSPSTFPRKQIIEIITEGISEHGDKLLQYGTTQGLKELRSELKNFMEWRGINVPSIDNILVLSGSQQGLDLFGKVFINEEDVVLMELPTYLAAINTFRAYNPEFVGLKMDDDGIVMDSLESILKELQSKYKKVKFLYTVPTCQNPTGVTLSMERRKRLLELAAEYDFLIVEDDPYSLVLYEPIDVASLKSMDAEGRVIHLSTFSKILSPGLRLGWVVADDRIIEKFVLAKQGMDLCTSPLLQYIAYGALKRKVIHENVTKIRALYKTKRDKMLEALETYFPEGCKWTNPIGGLFIFAWLPEKVNTKELIQDCIKKHKIAYVPGQSFFVDRSGTNTMRLNFSYPAMDEIEEGIKRLGQAIKERL
jgi:2-aminoadipate transaminase